MILAAIDLGSNSFRLEIVNQTPLGLQRILYLKESIRLAAGIGPDGCLTEQIQQTALSTLSQFRQQLSNHEVALVRAVGTQALRAAKNTEEFLAKANEILGVPIEIISGLREAELVFTGCISSVPVSSKSRLVIDIGGASTELAVGTGWRASCVYSVPVGCINTTLMFFRSGRLEPSTFSKAISYVREQFQQAYPTFAQCRWDEVYGTAGTVSAATDMLSNTQHTDTPITPDCIKQLINLLMERGRVRAEDFPNLKENRRDIIAAGLCIIFAVMEVFGIDQLHLAKGALRAGLFQEMLLGESR